MMMVMTTFGMNGMNKIKVSEATNTQLNWLVATAEKLDPVYDRNSHGGIWWGWTISTPRGYRHLYHYTYDWAQMGRIIEREKIRLDPRESEWKAQSFLTFEEAHGPTSLIAAARCYVASKLGEEVEVPEELT